MTRLRDLTALALSLAVVAAITVLTGDRTESVPVRYADVEVGETGVGQEFDLQVRGVRLTQEVQPDAYSEPLVPSSTGARLVVVDVVAVARTDTITLGSVWLSTRDGQRYAPRPELGAALPPLTQPGFTSTGTFVFQVPVDRVDGARLLVEPDTALFLTHDITVRVDLGLTAGTGVVTDPVLLEPSTTEVTP